MAFIIKNDYFNTISSDNLDTITGADDSLLDICEQIAIDEIKSYISHRYDVDSIFIDAVAWVIGDTYAIGDFVYYNNVSYKSLIDPNTGNTPDASPDEWEIYTRPAIIVQYAVDLALYHAHSRINPRNIPELRIIRREDAHKWLSNVMNMNNNPSFLPVITSTDGTDGLLIKYGSNDKRTNTY